MGAPLPTGLVQKAGEMPEGYQSRANFQRSLRGAGESWVWEFLEGEWAQQYVLGSGQVE